MIWGDPLGLARRRVLRATRHVLAWAAIPLGVFALIHATLGGRRVDALLLELATLIVVTALLWLDRESNPRRGAAWLCVGLYVVDVCALVQFGPLMGTGAMFLGTALFVTFFFERVLVAVAGVALATLGVGVALQTGWVEVTWAPPLGGTAAWLRMTGTVSIGATLFGQLFLWLVQGLEQAIAQETAAREREERAHTEREALLRAIAEGQRLEAVGRLAGGAAHDFNNVLMVISAALYSLKDKTLEHAHDELISDIESAVQMATATTRQLLAFAKQGSAPAGNADPATSVATLARGLIRLLPETIRVEQEIEQVPLVRMGSGDLEQCLLNLSLNARDAMPEGGTVTFRVRRAEDGGVLIEVEDSGHGMDSGALSRSTQLFFTTKPEGTGLGLPVVKRAVEASEGRFTIESAASRGTVARIWLPTVGEAPSPSDSAAPAVNAARGTLRILLLEDDPAIRRLLRRALEKDGSATVATGTVAEALSELDRSDDYDLLVTDACLPDGDSRRVIDRFRARPGRAVIVCSGHVSLGGVLSGIERDEVVFLQKPFAMDALLDHVAKLGRAGSA